MIIHWPTGLYDEYGSLDDAPNVTWYISNNPPPEDNSITIKVPVAEEIRPAPDKIFDNQTRRLSFGNLVYTINEAANTIPGSAVKTYSEGDIIEFSDDDRPDLTMPRNNTVQFRHDLNELDLESVGLDDEEVNEFNLSVSNKKNELEKQFLSIRTEINDIEIKIPETQKKLNESIKALNAANILEDQELIDKITSKRDQYNEELDSLVEQHNEKVEELGVIVDKLNRIDMVAK